MAGISNEVLKLNNIVRELNPLVSKLSLVSTYFDNLDQMVVDEIMSQVDVDALKNQYKGTLQAEVDKIVADEADKAVWTAQTGQAEANDKAEKLTTTISGLPVITPPPATWAAENVVILATIPALVVDVADLLDQISSVLG
tara:strand:- start:76340 stop:76762 length:423 start_codon:yes stop_codon:yes gene_type:complete